ncbi:MAG: RNA-protein complex protein Nop10 [Candidatus Hadarchaeum sp.]|uniref:RNA-protein complex protein Nop10 n=1 Tax=Candidatus Hadarchaeum sp. TaxID=2883567 RepID=UPI003D0DC126
MRMKKCKSCGIYTLKDICPSCGGQTVSPHPPRFSPQDPYGKYRRLLKKQAGVP